jgi:hypothetical protein
LGGSDRRQVGRAMSRHQGRSSRRPADRVTHARRR